MQTTLDLQHPNFHFDKIPTQSLCSLKFKTLSHAPTFKRLLAAHQTGTPVAPQLPSFPSCWLSFILLPPFFLLFFLLPEINKLHSPRLSTNTHTPEGCTHSCSTLLKTSAQREILINNLSFSNLFLLYLCTDRIKCSVPICAIYGIVH